MSLSENSLDESGYITGRIRRDDPNHEEYDPSEHSYNEDTADSSVRSPTPVPPPTAAEGPSRGPRMMRTARKRVLPPRRVTLSVPSGSSEEPSQSRSRSQSMTPSSPAIGVPVPQTRGMTAQEHYWVRGMADEVELHRHRLDNYRHSLDDILAILNSHDALTDRVMDISLDARRAIGRLHLYLAWMVGALVVVIGLLVWTMMH